PILQRTSSKPHDFWKYGGAISDFEVLTLASRQHSRYSASASPQHAPPRPINMSSRALNDDEVHNEMKKMVAFIKQEALEKAREIKVKAKLVRQESINIDATFQRKIKQAEVQKRIAQSNHINKSRLKVLQARQQMLEELFAETRGRLPGVTKDDAKYRVLLRDLGFYSLMEPKVTINCRQADVAKVKKAVEEATVLYKEALGDDVQAKVDEKAHLPKESAGGVILSAQGGRIKVNNTLETRLDILEENMLPQIRVLLFGHSPNRKFFN
ncbi:ATP synthase subunit-domain-containing protein, partial [Jimgerdemannia flammicorona]